MYYDQTMSDLVEPLSQQGPWELKNIEKRDDPVIPCLTCHPIHMENAIQEHPEGLHDPASIFYEREDRNPLTGLYLRSERSH